MEGEGCKPSIGERELSTKASETVTNLNAFNIDLVHFNLVSRLRTGTTFPASKGFLFQSLNAFLAFQRFFRLFSFSSSFLTLPLPIPEENVTPPFLLHDNSIFYQKDVFSWTSLINNNVLLLNVPIRFSH